MTPPVGARPARRAEVHYRELRHYDCNGKLTRNPYRSTYVCEGCGRTWIERQFEKFADEAIGLRFYVVDVAVDHSSQMLVWETEGKNRYAKAVPFNPWDQREKVKV